MAEEAPLAPRPSPAPSQRPPSPRHHSFLSAAILLPLFHAPRLPTPSDRPTFRCVWISPRDCHDHYGHPGRLLAIPPAHLPCAVRALLSQRWPSAHESIHFVSAHPALPPCPARPGRAHQAEPVGHPASLARAAHFGVDHPYHPCHPLSPMRTCIAHHSLPGCPLRRTTRRAGICYPETGHAHPRHAQSPGPDPRCPRRLAGCKWPRTSRDPGNSRAQWRLRAGAPEQGHRHGSRTRRTAPRPPPLPSCHRFSRARCSWPSEMLSAPACHDRHRLRASLEIPPHTRANHSPNVQLRGHPRLAPHADGHLLPRFSKQKKSQIRPISGR